MKNAKYILSSLTALLIVATSILTTACDRNENDVAPFGQQPGGTGNADGNALRIVASKQPFMDETGTRASTDFGGTYTTTFETGDEIGIIAVKDGAVLDDCNNVKLTYNAAGSKWEGDNPVYFKDGATYIAYSPYRAVMNGKKSTQEIYDAFTVSVNQSTAEKYAANDLMTSTTCTADKTAKTLTIAFEHRMAMLEISPVLYGRNSDNWKYPIKNSQFDGTVSMNGNTAISSFQITADAPYRCLRKQEKTITSFELSYKISDLNNVLKYVTCTTSGSYTFTGGQRKKIIPCKQRNIQVGDYYYSDGSIFPSDMNTTSPPGQDDGCIGVVFALGSTGIAADDNIDEYSGSGLTGAIHGYVSALSSTEPTAWQSSLYYWPPASKTTYKWGYSVTGRSNFACMQFAEDFETSPTSSGWYIPTLAQLKDMNATKKVCEPNMISAGGSGYPPPNPTTAIKPAEGVWIWTCTGDPISSDSRVSKVFGVWFMGSTGTQGEERLLNTLEQDNNKHSYVSHYVLTF